jgi:hypothetical protein
MDYKRSKDKETSEKINTKRGSLMMGIKRAKTGIIIYSYK